MESSSLWFDFNGCSTLSVTLADHFLHFENERVRLPKDVEKKVLSTLIETVPSFRRR